MKIIPTLPFVLILFIGCYPEKRQHQLGTEHVGYRLFKTETSTHICFHNTNGVWCERKIK